MTIDVNDIIGKKFGLLTVVELHHTKPMKKHGRRYFYLCQCECGNTTVVDRNNITNLHTRSCGCLAKQTKSITHKTHGLRKTRINNIWRGMKQRCYNPNRSQYYCYGGIGIKVCDQWKNDFQSFYDWAMANGYTDELTIDRIDVNGDYEPSNCRWIPMSEQARNTKKNHFITYNGQSRCIAEWAEIYNLNPDTLSGRLVKGWSIEKALNKPPRK